MAEPAPNRALERWVRTQVGQLRRKMMPARAVAITGSSAKSTTTLLLAHILSAENEVLCQAGHNGLSSTLRALEQLKRRHDYLVIETGAGEPGDLKRICAVLQPDVSIVTMVALEHKSHFKTVEAVQREKTELVLGLRAAGLAVLNADDPRVRGMQPVNDARVVTFGCENTEADYRVTNVRCFLPDRLQLTVQGRGKPITLQTRFAGKHFWLSTAAAATAGLELGVAPDVLAERVASFEPVLERCGVLNINGGPTFVVDTAKAPWHSIPLSFDMIANARAPRKRIVLGQMSDFVGSNMKYRDAYRMAREVADQVIFVGDHSHRSKANADEIESGRFKAFTTPRDVHDFLRATAIPNEIILLKGSSNLHLERIALAFARDVACWTPACGRTLACLDCEQFNPAITRKGGNANLSARLVQS